MIYTMTSNNTVYWNKIDKTFFGGENKLPWYEYTVLAGAGGLNGTGGDQGNATHTASIYNATSDSLKAFNGTIINTSDQFDTRGNNNVSELKFEFPTPTIVNHYRVWGSPSRTDRNPYDWTVQGSNDDVSWNILHTVDNATSAAAPEQPGSFTKPTSTSIELDTDNKRYSFENTIPYIYYKYEATDWTSRQICGIAQLAYYHTNIAANIEQISSIDMSKTNDVIILGSTLDISSTSTYSRVRIFHLDSSHEWSQNGTDIKGNIVESPNVRAAMNFVSRGDLDLGIVYYSDAVSENKIKIIYFLEENYHAKIVYPLTVLNEKKETLNFYNFLIEKNSKSIMRKWGFKTIR